MTTTKREKRAPYDFNRAVLPAESTENGCNRGHEKETVADWTLVAWDAPKGRDPHYYDDRRFSQPVTVRWYMGRSKSASTVYCSIWVNTRDGKRHFAGNGSAGGYGYHKQSAAFGDAVRSAGIKLDVYPSGEGDGAVRVAMRAIAKACGYGRCPTTIIT